MVGTKANEEFFKTKTFVARTKEDIKKVASLLLSSLKGEIPFVKNDLPTEEKLKVNKKV